MAQIVDVKEIAVCPTYRPGRNAVMVRWLMQEAERHQEAGRTAKLFLIVRTRPDGSQRQIVQLVATED